MLAGEPWRDPRTRSAPLIAVDMHEERMVAFREADRRAQAAWAEADAAWGKVGFLDRLAGRLGVRTAPVRDADEAEVRAACAENARSGRGELREELARVDHQARAVVRRREAERAAWSRQPDVAAARRELHGNRMVRAAIAAGDRRIAHLAVIDLPAAQGEVLLREVAQEDRLRRKAASQAMARPEPERQTATWGLCR